MKNLHVKQEEPKQETIEEAAKKEFPLLDTKSCRTGAAEEENLQLHGHRRSFIKGAKWQAERMYSEEEVLDLLAGFIDSRGKDFVPFKDIQNWFEQFKKKGGDK